MSDTRRLDALFEFVETCLAQAKHLSERDTGRLFGASGGEKARALYVAFKKRRKKTVGDIVPILSGLRTNIQAKYLNDLDDEVNHPTRLISSEHIYLALQKLIALTPQEKQDLGLPIDDSEILLNQAFLNMTLYQRPWNEERLIGVYRASTALNQSSDHHASITATREIIDTWIVEVAEAFQAEQLGYGRQGNVTVPHSHEVVKKKSPVEQLSAFKKVTREINRILIKTGASQLELGKIDSKADYIGKYLPYSFIKRLTQAVFENELLTEDFPIFIKNVAVERCGPFPLQIASSFDDSGTLSELLLNFKKKTEADPDYTELASHTVAKVTVQLHMRLPDEAEASLSEFSAAPLVREGKRGSELHFEFSSTGIGGTFSHVVKVLNFILLYDIDCLRHYFPIAHEVMMEQDIVRSGAPAPVIAHSLVSLCKVEMLVEAMQASQKKGQLKPYEYFAFNDPVGRGDFCGFDTLTSVANAAFQARLRAIKLTGVLSSEYLNDLRKSVNSYFLFRKARSYLLAYPFSSLAQQSFLYQAFGETWDQVLSPEDPYVYFDMQITVVESFLTEGLYRRAQPYLDKLAAAIESISMKGIAWYANFGEDTQLEAAQPFRIFSGTLLVRYELCQAQFSYLKGEPDDAWQRLRHAENHVNIRLAKYSLIKEVSQATFHPHYWLLSQIYFLKARLLLFFPFSPSGANADRNLRLATDVEWGGNGARTLPGVHIGRLHSLEKARLYAACNGDSELYSCTTAYQCCAYLIAAESGVLPLQRLGSREFLLTESQAKDWACRLRNQALIAYAEAGREYYYQIKEKSGISKQRHHNFGKFEIGAVPAIREQRVGEELGLVEFTRKDNQVSEKILHLDLSILGLDENQVRGVDSTDERGDTIYLFGMNACYLFFARGMYHLCSNETNEFGEKIAASSVKDWADKLAYSYRLFSYAWAIADDGGDISVEDKDGDEVVRVERPFTVPTAVAQSDKDVASIRDLYPHRITDIASLGRLYAATCAVLRGYTTTDKAKRQQYQTQMTWLLNDLHSEDACQQSSTQKMLGQQTRYNNHLTLYLRRCRRHIEKEWTVVGNSNVLNDSAIRQRRKELLKGLFSLRGIQ